MRRLEEKEGSQEAKQVVDGPKTKPLQADAVAACQDRPRLAAD